MRQMPQAGQNRTFSYYASRSQSEFNLGREALQDKPPIRRLPSRLQRLRKHFGWVLASVLVVGLFVYNMQLSTDPKVVAVTKSSDAPFLRDNKVYRKAAMDMLESTPANRNKLTINTAAVSARMKREFPELKEVSITLPIFGSQPVVHIQPADPALILASPSGTFVVDETGRALVEANAATDLSRFRVPTVSDQSGIQLQLGQQVLSGGTTEFIQTVMTQLQSQNVGVSAITLPPAASELDVYIKGQPYFVKFNLHDEQSSAAAAQVGAFLAVKERLSAKNTVPSQYIDVRIEGRAYYK